MNNNSDNNDKRMDILMSTITLYTTQLEDYDKSNFNACMTCIGFVGGLIAVIGAILCTFSGQDNASLLNETVSVIILLVPVIITLFLYNFSMNCRRSALFSGYVQFLEDNLNELLQKKDMLYSNMLIPDYYGKFPVNYLGSATMMIALLILMVSSFGLSGVFGLQNVNETFVIWYKPVRRVLIVFCAVFDSIYVGSL